MEMEKKRSKGSFFSLFDWNSKSRKKLIWNNPSLPDATLSVEGSKQEKENVESMPKTQISRIKVDENGASPSNIGCSDFSCALSISSDEEYGSKAPGLVARLMGLDSLPTSAVTELSSTSLYGSNSHGASHCHEDDFRSVDYMNAPLKVENSSRDAMESRAQKMGNWPMKRFQTEMLPPKSAKPIPVTHNKLLSPIKNPGFVSPRNTAHIMEAASKIIEGSPRPYMKNKMLSVGPSSAPLRITLDLKERLEALLDASVPGKSVGPSTANIANVKPSDRSNNLYRRTPDFKGSRDSEKASSCNLASKGKSVSQAIQSQTNVQSRDTLTSNGNKKYRKQKERTEIKSNHFSRNQKPSTEQVTQQRTGTIRNNNVLRKNNQKQNSLTNKGKSTSKIDSNKPTTRTSSPESSSGIRRTVNKGAINASTHSKRSSTRASVNQKEFPSSDTISQKKRYISMNVHETRCPDKSVNNLESKSIKCNITTDGSVDQDDPFNMKESKDVISFTFTSPLRRSMPGSLSSAEQVVGSRNIIGVDSLGHSDNLYPKKLSLSPPGLHMIDSDTLSDLLEKKLQELTSRISLPQCLLPIEESSADSRFTVKDKVPGLVNTTSEEQDRSFHPYLFTDNLDSVHGCHSSNDDPIFYTSQQLQESEEMEDCSCSSSSENGNDPGCQHRRAVAVSESPSASQSYLDSEDGAYGSTIYSSMQDEEVSNFSEINESVSLENEVSSRQSSSILPAENMAVKQLSEITTNLVDFNRSRNTGLEYVHYILTNAEFMAEEFVIGQADTVIMPNVFDRLVNASSGTENREEYYSKLEMKILFDFVSECIELKCKQAFVGSCKQWSGLMRSINRKRCLAQEFYKQMLGFRNMEEDVMVDELVGNDMSTGHGRWLDFDVEAFEEGIGVEEDILDNLMDELVSDLLHV